MVLDNGPTRRSIKLSDLLDDRCSSVATSIAADGTPSAGSLAPVAEVPKGDAPSTGQRPATKATTTYAAWRSKFSRRRSCSAAQPTRLPRDPAFHDAGERNIRTHYSDPRGDP